MRIRIKFAISSLLLLLLALNSGCTTTTGIKKKLTTDDLLGIKDLVIETQVKQPFDIYLSRDNETGTGFAIGGLLGATIESSIRTSNDRELSEPLVQQLINFRLQAVIEANLEKSLGTSGLFETISTVPPGQMHGSLSSGQARLEIIVNRWGYRRSSANDKQVTAFMECSISLTRGDTSKEVWQYDTQLFSHNTYYPEHLSNDIESVRTDMRGLAARLANRITNELKYAPNQ
ncbi:hypothetical protein [Rubellicoccus peritrichatus]|uniref:Lipoprotein n=1 Tax=Rubellicoccus peritrichatus TaxID=3080537 RepID=A0AAQ3LBT2_9BACT|nr:hypothetical protein [Puniceicoccus sp. CR14]WOO42506.1 hypothetical protein RZN69_05345 [Puniceicoccus sp. CR14]